MGESSGLFSGSAVLATWLSRGSDWVSLPFALWFLGALCVRTKNTAEARGVPGPRGIPEMVFIAAGPTAFARPQELIKRLFDITAGGALLLLLSPVLILVALMVKLSSPGPVLHSGLRVGKGGRHFALYKFRSMYDESGGRSAVESLNEKNGHLFKIRNDPRVTPLGAFLRRYSLDEFPQLFNVLAGHMSLVGPRPLPAEDLEPDGQSQEHETWARERSEVPPGITGLWQVSGRSSLPFEDMVELDLEYIRRWSLVFDFKILLETPRAVLSGRGAY